MDAQIAIALALLAKAQSLGEGAHRCPPFVANIRT